jgi:hypothetical protein
MRWLKDKGIATYRSTNPVQHSAVDLLLPYIPHIADMI